MCYIMPCIVVHVLPFCVCEQSTHMQLPMLVNFDSDSSLGVRNFDNDSSLVAMNFDNDSSLGVMNFDNDSSHGTMKFSRQ